MGRAETPSPSVLVRIGTVLVSIVLAAYLVAVWAMTTKPD
jgi:phage shock protein PspC (stress-responsive transcriptional regulator)